MNVVKYSGVEKGTNRISSNRVPELQSLLPPKTLQRCQSQLFLQHSARRMLDCTNAPEGFVIDRLQGCTNAPEEVVIDRLQGCPYCFCLTSGHVHPPYLTAVV